MKLVTWEAFTTAELGQVLWQHLIEKKSRAWEDPLRSRWMRVAGQSTQALRVAAEKLPGWVEIIDQRRLPHELAWERLDSSAGVARAIKDMHVRGAPLIGATAAWGCTFAAREAHINSSALHFEQACAELEATRPTAVNLRWAIRKVTEAIDQRFDEAGVAAAARLARTIMQEDVEQCRLIGQHGLKLIQDIAATKNPDEPVHILTHCNAGWLACVDYGTATSPIYQAHDAGIHVHVWVDETRPRNQGAQLTAWELGQHGVPHTLICDNTGGHLMQHALVDICIVGSDRTTRTGDVANKIGTYLKALAATDNGIPFYVALPSSTIDWSLGDGLQEIPIETRAAKEVTHVSGWTNDSITCVRICPEQTPVANYGFDVTPARLVSGLITERGVCSATEAGLLSLYPEKAG